MRVARRFTLGLASPYDGLQFRPRRSEIRNPDGSTVFEADEVVVPESWSQVATDILAQKYFRRAGVPARSRRVAEPGVPEVLQRRIPDVDALPEGQRFGAETDALLMPSHNFHAVRVCSCSRNDPRGGRFRVRLP